MDTPRQCFINKVDFEHVYEPAEDSYLLIDALESDLDFIRTRNPTLCLEIGSGSGVVITAFGMAFPQCLCLSTDINEKACLMTKSTASFNKVALDCVNVNLAKCFVNKKFDIILFNPPYVVTESEECGGKDLAASWAGGIKGREVIDRLLPEIPKKLSETGVFYMLLIEENIPEEVEHIMSCYGYHSQTVLRRRAKNERQVVLKFFK